MTFKIMPLAIKIIKKMVNPEINWIIQINKINLNDIFVESFMEEITNRVKFD